MYTLYLISLVICSAISAPIVIRPDIFLDKSFIDYDYSEEQKIAIQVVMAVLSICPAVNTLFAIYIIYKACQAFF